MSERWSLNEALATTLHDGVAEPRGDAPGTSGRAPVTAASRGPWLLLALAALLASCSKTSSEGSPSPGPWASSPAMAGSTGGGSGQAPAAPRMKELTPPAPDRVGVLAPHSGVPVGAKIPDAHTRDLDGKDVLLSSLYASTPILLVFYRGGWCPYCNSEIHALSAAYPEFQARGVLPVALSVDKPEAEAKLKATYTIPFPVLSDSSAEAIEAFHLVKEVGDEELAKMKSFGVDLESYSGKTHHEIAIPALFLVDRTGVVRWAHSDPDFKVRPTTAKILAAIDGSHVAGR